MNDTAPQTHRLFLALWPDDAVRTRLAELARQYSRRPVRAENLHMTLHFLGACTAEQLQCYSDAISGIVFQQFVINMDYLGGWARPGIQWLGASEVPPALGVLVESLATVLSDCGYRPDQRRFVPHVTLSRHARRPRIKAGLPPVAWRVDAVVLVESRRVDGRVCYAVRERWPAQD